MAINYSLRIQEDNRFRFWVSIFVFLVSALILARHPSSHMLFAVLVFLAYTCVYGFGHLLSKIQLVGPPLYYLLIVSDAVAITWMIHLTGGFVSPLYFLYLVMLCVCLYQRDIAHFVYGAVLSVCLYAGLLVWRMPLDGTGFFEVAGQVLLLGLLSAVLFVVAVMMRHEQTIKDKLISRANTLSHIADVLSGSLENSKVWLKTIAGLIEEEIHADGLKCRISLSSGGQQYLPPAMGKTGVQWPIMVGEYFFGTLLVTRDDGKPITHEDQAFFSSIARSLGLSLHRAKLWEDFQTQLEKMEATLRLNQGARTEGKENVEETLYSEGRTLENMLQMIRMERRGMSLKKEVCRLADLIDAEILKSSSGHQRRGIRFVVEGSPEKVPPFMADGSKLRQVIANLLHNAAKQTPGQGEVVVRVRNDDFKLVVSIHDQGPAIPADQLSTAFEQKPVGPLQPEDTADESDLDLAVAKMIVENHGGRVWVESAPGSEGRVFSFTIPLDVANERQLA